MLLLGMIAAWMLIESQARRRRTLAAWFQTREQSAPLCIQVIARADADAAATLIQAAAPTPIPILDYTRWGVTAVARRSLRHRLRSRRQESRVARAIVLLSACTASELDAAMMLPDVLRAAHVVLVGSAAGTPPTLLTRMERFDPL